MTRSKFSKVTAGLALMVVLFAQAGVALLHTHQGNPGMEKVTFQATSETSLSCQACALDGITTLTLDVESFVLPKFASPAFVDVIAHGILLSFSGSSCGRAPPAC